MPYILEIVATLSSYYQTSNPLIDPSLESVYQYLDMTSNQTLLVINYLYLQNIFMKETICYITKYKSPSSMSILTLICIEALQNQWCFRDIFSFAITCIWNPELCTASYLPHLILVSGHCLFPLSIEGIYLAYQLVPQPPFLRSLVMKFWEIHKKGTFC